MVLTILARPCTGTIYSPALQCVVQTDLGSKATNTGYGIRGLLQFQSGNVFTVFKVGPPPSQVHGFLAEWSFWQGRDSLYHTLYKGLFPRDRLSKPPLGLIPKYLPVCPS